MTQAAPITFNEAANRRAACASDRRHHERLAIPVLVRLTPLDSRRGSSTGPAITVVGKDLSTRGVGIYHEHRLPHRYCELQIDDGPFGAMTLRVELTWTRFTRQGWYESGGRVLACEEAEAA